MEMYMYKIFNKKHIRRGVIQDGSKYKQTTLIIFPENTSDTVIVTTRITQSQTKPDDFNKFIRTYKGINYWELTYANRIQNYIDVNLFIHQYINTIKLKYRKKINKQLNNKHEYRN
ncbi:hypothetical protein Phi46:3_gp021 [Cellulophaga phage phi46:3]|uniref:Uncharacterized protein n=1 Tax=Cellulophaga phage phi46:3 TaxID=1327985 RepID=S0A1T7_9CAUD|nr:hypothetical protein Phi46:3_gp021 [Cellulophaga phage phi46:3]AGO48765.1 hypothetical protein Phi46:3_gp021 [Cellulophaga phage phi46:3]